MQKKHTGVENISLLYMTSLALHHHVQKNGVFKNDCNLSPLYDISVNTRFIHKNNFLIYLKHNTGGSCTYY